MFLISYISGLNQFCVFPFTYEGEEHSECIQTGDSKLFWCATTANYDRDGERKNCRCKDGATTGADCY